MAKQFGDVVTYQMGKVSVNALVVQSNPQADGEHLTIVYVDPAVASSSMSGMLVDKAIARAFVTPLVEGKAYGWKDTVSEPAEAPVFETKHYADGSSATGVAPLPDLSSDEQKAKEATATIKSTSSFSGGHPGVAKPDGGDLGVGTAPIPESKVTNGL